MGETATEPKPRRRWYQFYLWHLLVLMTVVAIAGSWFEYRSRRRALVVRVYDAQKAAVDAAAETFVRELESDGFRVTTGCIRQGGSGEWRTYVTITAVKAGQEPLQCYVEVMGFVSHNAAGQATWASNLPMTISRQGRQLDNRLVDILTAMLRDHGWEYQVDNNLRDTYREQYGAVIP